MIRKSTVLKGVTANPSFFNPMLEYDTIPAVTYLTDSNGDTLVGGSGNPIQFGNWFTLGSHNCNCTPLSVDEVKQVEMSIYPNPTNDGIIYVKNASEVKSVSIYNSLCQLVQSFNTNAAANLFTSSRVSTNSCFMDLPLMPTTANHPSGGSTASRRSNVSICLFQRRVGRGQAP
jgi:hypothetical protein